MNPIRLRSVLLPWLALSLASPVLAQDFPNRPVHVIVPYAAGGSTDVVGRIVAKALGESLGQQAVVENRPGAAGSVGVAYALRAAPDGYTLAVSGVGSTLLHDLMGRSIPYNPRTDLDAVGYLGASSGVLITAPNSRFQTLADVIAEAKAKPDQVTYGSPGHASPGHLIAEYMASMADVGMTHVPYPGDSVLLADLIAGRIDIASVGVASAMAQIQSGAVRGLAVSSAERFPSLPDVPTVAEAGLPGYEAGIWNVLVVPKGVPPEVQQKLHAAVDTLMRRPDVQQGLLDNGVTAGTMAQADIPAFIQAEREKWQHVIDSAGIKANE